jgi:hypothetical protein
MAPSSISPEKQKSKSPSASKVMVTIFWKCEGVMLVDVITRRETINTDTYIRTLKELGQCFK